MLETAWLYRNVFPRLRQKDPNYKSLPSNEEWDLAKEICGKLKLFYDVTQLFSGTQVPTANIYFNKVCDINVVLKNWSASPNPLISNMACSMRVKFDKYWEEIHGMMGVAVILDPRYKLATLEYKFSMLCQNQDECLSKIERIKQICYDLLHEYQQNLSNSSNAFEDSTQKLQMNAEQDDDAAYQLYIRQKKRKNGSFVKTEFDHYIEEDVHPLSADFDILA
nr:zinc finger BED domain-containing protein RICESLEEPER 1-like [Arachis hypogaea]